MFESRTREKIKAEMLADLDPSSGLNALEGGFADQILGPPAVQIEKAYMTLEAIIRMLHIDETCGPLIDVAADNYSITRKDGIKATAQVDFVGESGAFIPAGAFFSTADGLVYELQGNVTLGGDGTGHGVLVAMEVGSRYNVATGVIDKMYVNPIGVDNFSVQAAVGGVDVESDAALVGRYYDRKKRPATSGNPNHYRQWAMEVPGVGEAKVISLVDGPGTVGVTLVGADFGPVEPSVVEAVVTHIEAERTVGIEAPPYVKSAEGLPISVKVVSKLDTSVTPASVAAAFEEQLGKYFRGLVAEKYAQTYDKPSEDVGYTLSFNRVANIFMNLPGVKDYTSLTVNGGKVDVTIGKDQVPTIGGVSVS